MSVIMKNVLTFIIPVRHQKNAVDWNVVKNNLRGTIKSLKNQDHPGWKAVVVANYGADLPDMPEGFEVKRVNFPPNPIFKKGSAPKEDVYEAVRIDKGRRVLSGLLHAGEMGHIMIVDDDDFVNRNLTSFIAKNPNANGFFVKYGYIWGAGEKWILRYDGNFSHLCGTSHIVRSDLYNLPCSFDSATESYIKKMLGSHKYIFDLMKENGTPLSPLPFYGAIYRVGHTENHSQSSGMLDQYFLKRWLWRYPVRQIKNLLRLKRINKSIINDFFSDKYY